ncbi:MAG: molecular chaperone HtpG, partial [Lentisphaerae bacterium]
MGKRKFKAEVQQLLHLVIHSLYTKKEIAIRELISNASDALDRARYEALTNSELIGADEELRIRILPDPEKRQLVIWDNGIGMDAEELEKHLGTIANSGTKRFLESLSQNGASDQAEFIGQFGVGFYAAFMLAQRVTVRTKRRGGDGQAWLWSSEGEGNYVIEETHKDEFGTEICLELREGLDEYLEDWKLQKVVKQYSDFIAYPIYLRKKVKDEKGEEEK